MASFAKPPTISRMLSNATETLFVGFLQLVSNLNGRLDFFDKVTIRGLVMVQFDSAHMDSYQLPIDLQNEISKFTSNLNVRRPIKTLLLGETPARRFCLM